MGTGRRVNFVVACLVTTEVNVWKEKLVDIEIWQEKTIQDTELTERQKYWWAYVTVSVALLFYFCRFACQLAIKPISGKCAKCRWGYGVAALLWEIGYKIPWKADSFIHPFRCALKKALASPPPPRCHCRYPHLHSGLSFHVPAILRQPGCCENTNSFDDKSQLELCSKMFVDSRMLKFLPENGSLLTLSFLSLANFHQDWWIMNMIRLSYQAHQIILSSSQQKAPVFDMSWRHLRSLLLQART